MINYTKEQLKSMLEKVQQEYDGFVKEGLKLDMSRGKPSPDQLSLSNDMKEVVYDPTQSKWTIETTVYSTVYPK